MNRCFFTTITIIAITVISFTACTKKSETQADFNIYSIWRYVSSADVEHGGTWVNESEKSIAIFNDGEYAVVISGSYAWRGVLHDRGDYSYTFNAVTRLDYETGIFYNVEGQSPYTFVLKYDPQTRQLVSADGTVEEYYEWFSESGFVPDLGFSSTHQEILTADISAFAGTWVNSEGGTYTIPQPQSLENEFPGGFKQFEEYYTWWHPSGDFGIYLVPAGVDLILHGNVLSTDKTKMRLVTEDLHSAPVVYYREGELPVGNNAAADDPQLMLLGGRIWHFQSGEWLYFFQHFRELTTVFFYSDGNVHVTSEETSLSVSGKWKITDDGELEIRPDNQGGELNIPEVLYFSYQIRGNILTLTDNNPNFGKAGDEGTYYEVFRRGR